MDPNYLRRQKEIARKQQAAEKRAEKAARRNKEGKSNEDDDVAAIQAAIDAGLNPGKAEDR